MMGIHTTDSPTSTTTTNLSSQRYTTSQVEDTQWPRGSQSDKSLAHVLHKAGPGFHHARCRDRHDAGVHWLDSGSIMSAIETGTVHWLDLGSIMPATETGTVLGYTGWTRVPTCPL